LDDPTKTGVHVCPKHHGGVAGRSDKKWGWVYPKRLAGRLDDRTHHGGATYPIVQSEGWTIGEGGGGPHVGSSNQSVRTPFFLGHFLTQGAAM